MGLSNKLREKIIIAFLIVCVGSSALVEAHTFHTSLTRIEYNEEEQLAEITIQVFAHDLEDILTRRNDKKRVLIGKSPNAETLAFDYLQEAFTLKNNKGEIKELSFVGMEQKTDGVWLYLETKMPEGLYGASVRNKIFFDLLQDQVNLVHFKFDDKTVDFTFKSGSSGFKAIPDKKEKN